MSIRLEYDPEADGAYLWLVDIDKRAADVVKEVWPAEFQDQIGLLFDSQGKLMGMELQPASLYLERSLLAMRDEE